MSAYDLVPEAETAFAASLAAHAAMLEQLRDHAVALDWDAAAAEEFGAQMGRQTIRLALQGFADLGAAVEQAAHAAADLPAPRDGDGRVHRACESGHERTLTTQFGDIRIARLAWRAIGRANLHPRDAALNLPRHQHSHPVAKWSRPEVLRGLTI